MLMGIGLRMLPLDYWALIGKPPISCLRIGHTYFLQRNEIIQRLLDVTGL